MKNRAYILTLMLCILSLTAPSAIGYQATFTPALSINEEYTDNLFLSHDNQEHDYITTISPQFSFDMSGEKIGAEISYAPTYSIYDKFSENDTWRQSVQLTGRADVSKYNRIDIRNSFLRTEEPLSEADIATQRLEDSTALIDNTIRRNRQTYYTNAANVRLTHRFGESDSAYIQYLHNILENDDPDSEDSTRHNPSIGFTYWFFPLWGLDSGLSYTKGEFDDSDDFDEWSGNVRLLRRVSRHFEVFVQYNYTSLDYDEDADDYQTYNPSIGLTYSSAENLFFSLDTGFYLNDTDGQDADTGLTTNIGLSKTFRRGSLRLTGSSGHEQTSFGAENLGSTEYYEAGGSATYVLTRHISGNIYGSYRKSEYEETVNQREDKITRCGLGFTIEPLAWMSIGLNYTYRYLDSTRVENDCEENRAFVSLTLIPTRPYRISR